MGKFGEFDESGSNRHNKTNQFKDITINCLYILYLYVIQRNSAVNLFVSTYVPQKP